MEGNDDLFFFSLGIFWMWRAHDRWSLKRQIKPEKKKKMRSELNWTMLMNNFAPSPSRCSAGSVFVSYLSVHFSLKKKKNKSLFSRSSLWQSNDLYFYECWDQNRARANTHSHSFSTSSSSSRRRRRFQLFSFFFFLLISFTGISSGFRWIIFMYGLLSIDVRANKSLRNNNGNFDLMRRISRVFFLCVTMKMRLEYQHWWHWSPDFYWTNITTTTTSTTTTKHVVDIFVRAGLVMSIDVYSKLL